MLYQLVDLLSTFVWLNGVIIVIAGVFYLYGSSVGEVEITLSERRRIAFLLGLSMLGVGISDISTGWARGLIRYLVTGGEPLIGWVVLTVRVSTTVVMVIALFDVVLTWRRGTARVEERQREKVRGG